ncbi:MAG: class I SAM-dependent methyltransferase [Hyphomicrobiaceae bacterium]
MQNDVESLRSFYATSLGHVVRRLIGRKIRARWRNVPGGRLCGLGFATPYLKVFRDEVDCLAALMPARQGALVWPRQGKASTAMVDEEHLPLPDNSIDRLLVVHGLENTGAQQQFLREIWRVLAPGGRLLLVVPNRRGVWARMDRTPFGFGHPYSRGQLESLLIDAMFNPLHWDTALHAPPLPYSFVEKSAVAWERIGQRVMPVFAGVLLVEAAKELAAPSGTGKVVRRSEELVLLPNV